MIKYKEKWDKLKESARRKKEAKAAAGAVKQPIAEDPEGEERPRRRRLHEHECYTPSGRAMIEGAGREVE